MKPNTNHLKDPESFSKVPFVTFEQPNWKAIGNNHIVSDPLFFVSSYILVLRVKIDNVY